MDNTNGTDGYDEEHLWVEELKLLTEETMINHRRAELHENPTQARMALAQVVLCHDMMKALVEDDDWSQFKESVYDYIHSETARYREARLGTDRDLATIMLARVRCATTLARRLDNPDRKTWMAGWSKLSPTVH